LEYCVRVDVESPEFDGVSDYDVDVYVLGDTLAPVAYDAYVTYDANKVHVTAPGTNTLIKLPGASAFADALPDSDGTFVAGATYLSGGPGTAGDGTLVRLGLDIGGSGVVTFDFDTPEPTTAYASATGAHPVTRMTAQLAINEDCPPGERPQPSPTPEEEDAGPFTPYPDKPVQQEGRYRWANISVERPEGSDIYVTRDFDIFSRGGDRSTPTIELWRLKEDGGGNLLIDAETGKVLWDTVEARDRAGFDVMLSTLRFEGSDAPTNVWPYSDTAPRGPQREVQIDRDTTVVFFEPDPAAGIALATDGASVQIRTARWIRAIDRKGALASDFGRGQLGPADVQALDRFILSTELENR
jgi:hypothetical protein